MSAIGNGNPTQRFSLDDYLNQVIANTGDGTLSLVPAGNPHGHEFNPWARSPSSSSSSSLSPFSSPSSSRSQSPSLSSSQSPSPVQQYWKPRAGNRRLNTQPPTSYFPTGYAEADRFRTIASAFPLHERHRAISQPAPPRPTPNQQQFVYRPVPRYGASSFQLPPAWTPLLPGPTGQHVPQAGLIVPAAGRSGMIARPE
jgi:hypothetical protein